MSGSAMGYDLGRATWTGARSSQQDALRTGFDPGTGCGFVVLGDGMGGHAAGDLASRVVVDDVSGALSDLMQDTDGFEAQAPTILRRLVESANNEVAARIEADAETKGMGTTLVALGLIEDRLHWASVGDSPLFLWRDGQLEQLNEDHSLGPMIDLMAANGQLPEDVARSHPDRNALTSVLMGAGIEAMDIPGTPFSLQAGDVLICASDGLQFLSNDSIRDTISGTRYETASQVICDRLMTALHNLDNPQQDNTAIAVVQLRPAEGAMRGPRQVGSDGEAMTESTAGGETEGADMDDPGDEEPFSLWKEIRRLAIIGVIGLAVGYFFFAPDETPPEEAEPTNPNGLGDDLLPPAPASNP